MRLATLRVGSGGAGGAAGTGGGAGEDAGATTAAVEVGGAFLRVDAPDVGALLARSAWRDEVEGAIAAGVVVPGDPDFAPVVTKPAKVICCGLNYRAHIAEMGRGTPEYPTLFPKFADSLVGADDEVLLTALGSKVDWEVELAVVVGSVLWQADAGIAASAIAGYTVANDFSLRDLQWRTSQWMPGKAVDASTPVGPVLVTADEFDPAVGRAIRCTVNGMVMQESVTSDLLFDSAALLAGISAFTTLRPGDVVLTGTPGGVGAGRDPERFLQAGDTVLSEIEGIGTLHTRVR